MIADRRRALCASLREAREKKGISLDDIAASTKISRALLKGLEDSDVSRWPSGLYRRSYLRDYLRAIDLAPDSVLTEFTQLFPDDATLPVIAPSVPEPDESPFSIMLADDRPHWRGRAQKRILAATIDAVIVVMVAAGAWWGLGAGIGASLAVVAVCYYSAATAVLGHSFGVYCLDDRSWRRGTKPALDKRPDGLFERFRHIKDMPAPEGEPMSDPIAGVPANAAFFRTPFLP